MQLVSFFHKHILEQTIRIFWEADLLSWYEKVGRGNLI
jgi:hypothetical protein